MSQWFGFDEIKELEVVSTTSIKWLAGSHLRIDGQGVSYPADSFIDTTLVGVGGVDISPIVINSTYNVFAIVLPSGENNIIASLDATLSGYLYRQVGSFSTDGSGNAIFSSSKNVGEIGDVKYSRLSESDFLKENGLGWVLYDNRSISGSKLETLIGQSTLDDARGRFLRAKSYTSGINPDGDIPLGSLQSDATARNGLSATSPSHGHQYRALRGTGEADTNGGGIMMDGNAVQDNYPAFTGTPSNTKSEAIGGGTAIINIGTGDNETRPSSLTLNVFIKIN